MYRLSYNLSRQAKGSAQQFVLPEFLSADIMQALQIHGIIGYPGGYGRRRKLQYPNTGSVAQRCLPAIYTAPEGEPSNPLGDPRQPSTAYQCCREGDYLLFISSCCISLVDRKSGKH